MFGYTNVIGKATHKGLLTAQKENQVYASFGMKNGIGIQVLD